MKVKGYCKHVSTLFNFLTLIPTSLQALETPWGPTDPVANPTAVLSFPDTNVRFTILTDRVIRIEQGPGEDRKTLTVINRNLRVPKFSSSTDENGILTVSTDYLTLKYNTLGQTLNSTSLSITGKFDHSDQGDGDDDNNDTDKEWMWKYGDTGDEGNLLGTIRTLDNSNIVSLKCSNQPTEQHCEPGLISRNGFAIVDDSRNWALRDGDNSGVEWWDGKNKNQVDLYIFGHGHDYKAALSDFVKIGGRIPLLPRYTFGVWFSRWYDYNPSSSKAIVDTFQELSLPLDVFVLDMNWHSKQNWTGYSWDEHLFSPSEDAIAYLKHNNLAVTLNLHDANGLNPWETRYEDMCQALNWPVQKNMTIPFTIDNKKIMLALEDVVLKPLEEENGVDFWWIDWQQGEDKYGGDGDKKNPTIWTAHIRSTDRYRRHETDKRAMVLARWGGLGSHRYPVHFSGDAAVSWSQLAFQPYFSMTATNVGAIWSHDVAGYLSSPELFTRWIQWSVVSGVVRTHDKGMSAGRCAKNDRNTCTTTEPWNAPPNFAMANYKALRLRAMLIPYIYTLAHEAYESGLWFVRPLYYDFPKLDGAYSTAQPPDSKTQYDSDSQFMFGNDILAIPVVRPANTTTSLALLNVWIPPGTWVGLSGGQVLVGEEQGTAAHINADIDEIPLFAKAGAVIPSISVLSGSTIGLAMKPYNHLIWTIYLAEGAPLKGSGTVYEDDGISTVYLAGQSAETVGVYEYEDNRAKFRFKVETHGFYSGIPPTRATTLKIINVLPPLKVSAMNKTIPFSRFQKVGCWSYDALQGAVIVELPPVPVSTTVDFEMDLLSMMGVVDGIGFKLARALTAKETLDEIRMVPGSQTGQDKFPSALMKAASSGSGLEYLADNQGEFLKKVDVFHNLLNDAVEEIGSLATKSMVQSSYLRTLQDGETEEDSSIILNAISRAYQLLKEAVN